MCLLGFECLFLLQNSLFVLLDLALNFLVIDSRFCRSLVNLLFGFAHFSKLDIWVFFSFACHPSQESICVAFKNIVEIFVLLQGRIFLGAVYPSRHGLSILRFLFVIFLDFLLLLGQLVLLTLFSSFLDFAVSFGLSERRVDSLLRRCLDFFINRHYECTLMFLLIKVFFYEMLILLVLG